MNRKATEPRRGKSGLTRHIRKKVLKHKKMKEDHLAYEEKLTTLHKHASQLGLASSIDEIARYTLDAMEFALGFDFADVAMVENRCLRVVGYRGHPSVLWEAPLGDTRSVKAKAANTKKTVRVPDTKKDPAYVDGKGFDWNGPPTMLSELAVPVIVDDETLAVLNAEWSQPDAFTSEDQSLLEILAFHVSSAFKRLKYEERLMALHKHSLQLSSATSIDDMTKFTLDAAEFALGFDAADICTVENGYLKLSGARGANIAFSVLPLNGPGITTKAANTKSVIRVSDTRKEAAYVDGKGLDWKGAPTMLSEIAVPVITQNEVVAVVNVESTQPNAFTSEDQTLLEILAFHVGSAFKRLKYEEKLMALHWHALRLSSATSTDQITEHTLDAMEFGLGFDYANVNFVDGRRIVIKGARGEKNFVNPDLSLDGPGLIVRSAIQKTPVRVADTRKEPAYVDPMGVDWSGPPTMLSELAVPVVIDGETIAVLNVESTQPSTFTDEDQTLLETLAIHVASDLRRLRDLEALRRSEQRFRGLLEHLPIGVYRSTPEGRILEANQTLADILGFKSVFQVQQIDVTDLYVQKTDRMDHERKLRLAGSDIAEFELQRKDGRRIWVRDYSIATFSPTGGAIYSDGILTDITDRKHSETEIRKLSQFLESVIDNANVWLNVLDQNANVLTWNKAAEEISGYSREEVVGHNKIWEWLYPDEQYRKEVIATANEIIEKGLSEENVETRITRKDSQVRIIAWNSRAIFDENNRTIGSVALARDVTEQERMQKELERYSKHLEERVAERTKELRAARERLEFVITSNPAVIYAGKVRANASDWDLTYISERVVAVLGFEPQEFIGHPEFWESHVHPEDLRPTLAEIPSFWKEGQRTFEYRFLHKDGAYRWIREEAKLIRDADGKPMEVNGYWIDITERKRAENALRESEERLNTIIQASPEGIIVTDLNGDIVDCNQAALQLYRCASKLELVGKNTLELIAKKDQEMASEAFRRLSETGAVRNMGYSLISKDGHEFPVEFSASMVKDAAGAPVAYVAVLKDLTEQIEIQDRLRKAERMAVIGETAAMVGHDLRNPLQGISGAAYVLRQKWGPTADPQTMEMLALIDSGLEYADKIVKELLDYSREIPLELTETTAKAVMDAAMLQVKIPENVIIRNMMQDAPALSIDAAKIQRVFVNLIGNAIDAMPKDGELTISSSESNGILEVKFMDTGEGIADHVMKNLWKPLKTTKSRGMGLGLAICKRIVEAHGGTIQVESAVGKGSTFTINIPTKRKASTLIEA